MHIQRTALGLLCILNAILSCSRENISEARSRTGVNGIVQGMTVVSTENGETSWILEADSLISGVLDTNDVYGIELSFFDERGCRSSLIIADSGKQVVTTQDMFASGGLLIDIFENGFRKWRISADSVWQRNRQRRIDIFRLDLHMSDSTGKEIAVISADSGSYFLFSKDLRARGNLVIRLASGGSLSTESLYYSEERKIFTTDGRIVYVERDNILEGVGFESDQEMKNIRVFNAVSGKIKTDDI